MSAYLLARVSGGTAGGVSTEQAALVMGRAKIRLGPSPPFRMVWSYLIGQRRYVSEAYWLGPGDLDHADFWTYSR